MSMLFSLTRNVCLCAIAMTTAAIPVDELLQVTGVEKQVTWHLVMSKIDFNLSTEGMGLRGCQVGRHLYGT